MIGGKAAKWASVTTVDCGTNIRNMPPHIMLLTTLVLILSLSEGNRDYEFQRLRATTSIQYFTSRNYPVSYPSNHTSEWLISTDYVNHTVELEVIDCSVEYETKQRLCLYEKISIYDGNSTNGSALTPKEGYCCIVVPATYKSTQSQMYVQFFTDNSNVDKGFKMSYFSDGPTTTTQTTTTTTTITTSTMPTSTTKAGTMTSLATIKTTDSSSDTSTTSFTTFMVTMTLSITTTGSSSNENWKYIIAGCVSGLVLIGIVITPFICYLWCKKVNTVQQRPTSATSVRPASFKVNQNVIPADADTPVAPDTGENNFLSSEQIQNPVFEIDTPIARANVLAPIESRLM